LIREKDNHPYTEFVHSKAVKGSDPFTVAFIVSVYCICFDGVKGQLKETLPFYKPFVFKGDATLCLKKFTANGAKTTKKKVLPRRAKTLYVLFALVVNY
jgi:hypothetical protein